MKKIIPTILSIILFILLWKVLYTLENQELIIPSISSTFNEIYNIIFDEIFLTTISITISRTIIGFILSLIFGFTLGLISGFYPSVERFIKPYVVFMRSTPTVAIMLLALLYIKSYNVPILVNFLICFPIIYQEIITGVKNVDKSLLDFAKVHKIPKLTTFEYIYMPTIISHVISGILNTISLGFKITISSEILSIPKYGIGSNIYNAKIYLNTAEVFAWIIIIFIISFAFDYLIILIKNKLLKGRRS